MSFFQGQAQTQGLCIRLALWSGSRVAENEAEGVIFMPLLRDVVHERLQMAHTDLSARQNGKVLCHLRHDLMTYHSTPLRELYVLVSARPPSPAACHRWAGVSDSATGR